MTRGNICYLIRKHDLDLRNKQTKNTDKSNRVDAIELITISNTSIFYYSEQKTVISS